MKIVAQDFSAYTANTVMCAANVGDRKMYELDYLKKVKMCLETLLENASHSFNVNFKVLNECLIETDQLIKQLESKK